MDDADLVGQVLQGNLGAYGDLVERYTAQIRALCARVRRADVVDELVQETFCRGLQNLADLREPAKFGPWLCTTARNLCRDWFNDPQRRDLPLDPVAPVHAPAESPNADDRIAHLRRCIDKLPVDLREVVDLRYAGGRITYQEMADRLRLNFGQVNKLLTRARRILRGCLEREDPTTS